MSPDPVSVLLCSTEHFSEQLLPSHCRNRLPFLKSEEIKCFHSQKRYLLKLKTSDIVHADIKPDNFLVLASPGLTAAPALQLIDFGKAVDLTLVTDDKENINTAKQEEKPVKVEADEDRTRKVLSTSLQQPL